MGYRYRKRYRDNDSRALGLNFKTTVFRGGSRQLSRESKSFSQEVTWGGGVKYTEKFESLILGRGLLTNFTACIKDSL